MSEGRKTTTLNIMEEDRGDHIPHSLVSEVKPAASTTNELLELVHLWDSEDEFTDTDQELEEDSDNCSAQHENSVKQAWDEENQQVNYCTSPARSEVSIITYSSWRSSPVSESRVCTENREGAASPALSEDSAVSSYSWASDLETDVSEVHTPDYQDVDEEIKKVCDQHERGEDRDAAPSPARSEVSTNTYSSWRSSPDSESHVCTENREGAASPTPSENSTASSYSWASDLETDVSDVYTPDYQDVDEEIKKVCHHYLWGRR
ncbi:uncharacterized protein LOC113173482 [Anabas testudineus]|uniref:uncharacterized protein LOC113173482 n=1 Tax=Anabas testudineus TaxID=64144 RepID=UPI000E458D30|nr:uncharacterized protein LOC113173482 [Anabas testudineus]